MAIYSRYLLAQIARPMITAILVALIALLAERTLRVIDLVVGWRGSLFVVFEMLGYLIPHYMGLALPVAFFLGILLTFSRLSREGELAAINASGRACRSSCGRSSVLRWSLPCWWHCWSASCSPMPVTPTVQRPTR